MIAKIVEQTNMKRKGKKKMGKKTRMGNRITAYAFGHLFVQLQNETNKREKQLIDLLILARKKNTQPFTKNKKKITLKYLI